MAKLGKINHNNKRIKLVEKYAERRTALRKEAKNMRLSFEVRAEARRQLGRLPRNSAAVRVRNRCLLTGRPRGVLSYFKVSRIKFRELAHRGELPGVVKSSW
jgi:small subunit ribosomal protein S14